MAPNGAMPDVDDMLAQQICWGRHCIPTIEVGEQRLITFPSKLNAKEFVWLKPLLGNRNGAVFSLKGCQTLTKISSAISEARCARTEKARLVMRDGLLSSTECIILLEADGKTLTVFNTKWPDRVKADMDSISWVAKRLQREMDDASLRNSAESSPHARRKRDSSEELPDGIWWPPR